MESSELGPRPEFRIDAVAYFAVTKPGGSNNRILHGKRSQRPIYGFGSESPCDKASDRNRPIVAPARKQSFGGNSPRQWDQPGFIDERMARRWTLPSSCRGTATWVELRSPALCGNTSLRYKIL